MWFFGLLLVWRSYFLQHSFNFSEFFEYFMHFFAQELSLATSFLSYRKKSQLKASCKHCRTTFQSSWIVLSRIGFHNSLIFSNDVMITLILTLTSWREQRGWTDDSPPPLTTTQFPFGISPASFKLVKIPKLISENSFFFSLSITRAVLPWRSSPWRKMRTTMMIWAKILRTPSKRATDPSWKRHQPPTDQRLSLQSQPLALFR